MPELCLLNDDRPPIHRYDFYVRLLTSTAWRVPVVSGKLPREPPEDAQTKEKGIYALFLMMLFRPHRSFDEIVYVSIRDVAEIGTEDDIWTA